MTEKKALPNKKRSEAYLEAKRACSDMRELSRILNSGPSGEYAQLALDSEPLFDNDEEES